MSENQILKDKLSKELSNEKIKPFSENEIINQSNNISFSEEDICEEKNDLNDNIEGVYLDNSEDIYKKYKQLKEKYIIKKKKLNDNIINPHFHLDLLYYHLNLFLFDLYLYFLYNLY